MRFLSDEKDRLEEAEKLYKEVLEINPDDYNSSIGVADCCLYMDKLEEAKELYIALIRRNAYDNYVRNQIMNVNEKLIEYYKQEDKHDTISIFKRAWCLFENFRYQEIIDLTEGMTVEEENENQYCELLGKTYAGLKQYEKSIEYFKQWSDKLEKETDENEDRDYNLNYLYSEIGNQYKKLERYDEALEYYDKALAINEDDVDVLNSKGNVLLLTGRYEESLNILERGLEIDGNFYSLYINKCKVLLELGYDGDALDDAIRAQNIYPYNPECYLLQMKLYNRHGESDNALQVYETAVKYFKKAIDNMGNEPYKVFFNNIARCYRRLKKYEEAIKYYDKELEIFGGDFDLYDKKAGVYVLMDKYQDAIDIYLECLDVEGIDPVDVYDNIGDIYKDDIKDYNEAIKWYKMAIKLEPEHRYEYRKIGIAYYKKKKYKTAIKFYKKQLEFDEHAYTYVKMGEAYKELHNAVKAKENYQKALDLYKNIKYPDASHYTEMAKCSKELLIVLCLILQRMEQ
ncbi:tetratricopeptide repeat protein [Inconstantimicrobium porci]|nr:tetratricopeptide repeat protein [Inconstantimicrobium porci]